MAKATAKVKKTVKSTKKVTTRKRVATGVSAVRKKSAKVPAKRKTVKKATKK